MIAKVVLESKGTAGDGAECVSYKMKCWWRDRILESGKLVLGGFQVENVKLPAFSFSLFLYSLDTAIYSV
jgi:hypothetical protein